MVRVDNRYIMKKMPLIGIACSVALLALGFGGYALADPKSITALIPAFWAIPLLIFSLISLQEKNLKMGMHIAALVGLLGFIAPVGMVASKVAKGTLEWKLSTFSMLTMSLICLVFLVLCVKSFIDVRKAKKKAANA